MNLKYLKISFLPLIILLNLGCAVNTVKPDLWKTIPTYRGTIIQNTDTKCSWYVSDKDGSQPTPLFTAQSPCKDSTPDTTITR